MNARRHSGIMMGALALAASMLDAHAGSTAQTGSTSSTGTTKARIGWARCGGHLQCAHVQVALGWNQSRGRKTTLSVIRYLAAPGVCATVGGASMIRSLVSGSGRSTIASRGAAQRHFSMAFVIDAKEVNREATL